MMAVLVDDVEETKEVLELRDDDEEWRRKDERTAAVENWARMVWKREFCMMEVVGGCVWETDVVIKNSLFGLMIGVVRERERETAQPVLYCVVDLRC